MLCHAVLQAEKQMVKQISKLKSQREKIREFQGAQEGLGQLEAEAKKLKAVIDEVGFAWAVGGAGAAWVARQDEVHVIKAGSTARGEHLHVQLEEQAGQVDSSVGAWGSDFHKAALPSPLMRPAACCASLPPVSWQIDGEVNILRGEREQAKDIIDDLSKKLNAVNAVIDEFQSERQVGPGAAVQSINQRSAWG